MSWHETRFARGDLAEEIARLKEESAGDVLAHGGASFVQSLGQAGLIDEYRFVVSPVAFGEGLRVFKNLAEPIALRLVEATTLPTGALGVVYQPA